MKKISRLSVYGVKYIVRLCLQLLLQIGIICAAAGTFQVGTRLLIYFGILAASYAAELGVVIKRNPEVLNERVKNIKAGTKSWDKVLLSLYVACSFIVMNIFIGLSIRYDWPHISFSYMYIGLAFYIFSVIVSTKSLLENKYFESSSRIQTERNQTVVSTGVYSVVRHPGYSAIILWAVAIPLFTGSVYTWIPAVAIILIITIRTYLEDQMLKRELKGYQEYSRKVKYRLVPFLW